MPKVTKIGKYETWSWCDKCKQWCEARRIFIILVIAETYSYLEKVWQNLQSWCIKACPESIQPCTMKNRNIYWRYNTQEILYTGQWSLCPLQRRCFGISQNSLSVSSTVQNILQNSFGITISCPVLFSWISSMVWNLFPFKGDFSFGKSQKLAPNLGCRGTECRVSGGSLASSPRCLGS